MSDRGTKILTGGLIAVGAFGIIYTAVLESRTKALLAPGQPAPAFSMEKYGGGEVSLADLQGKVVLLDFWATWCPPCVQEMPYLVSLSKEFEPQGVALVAASRDDPPDHKATVGVFIARRVPDLKPYAAFASDAVARAYNVEVMPTLFIIGRDGKILRSHQGALSESQLRREIEDALAQNRSP